MMSSAPSSILPAVLRPEVLLTNDASGQMWNTCIWDPQTGAALASYRGSVSSPRTTCLVGSSFLMSAQPAKPVLNVWHLNRSEQLATRKQTVPGPLSAMACDQSSGKFLAGAVKEKIYVWQVQSGRLMAVLTGHFQPVTNLQFSDDGAHLVSGGADGLVLAWDLASAVVLSKTSGGAGGRPRWKWGCHSLEVTDLKVGAGGNRSRIFSVSKDQTAKVLDLASGRLLLDVTFSVPLSSVAPDPFEANVYVGTAAGPIHMFSLRNPPRDLCLSLDENQVSKNTFSGHSGRVTCLSVSVDGSVLASGSDDCDVRLWHVRSRQCLRTMGHKGAVSAVVFTFPLGGMLDQGGPSRQGLTLAAFDKTMAGGDDGSRRLEILVKAGIPSEKGAAITSIEANDNRRLLLSSSAVTRGGRVAKAGSSDSQEVLRLRRINLSLYQKAVKTILSSCESDPNA